ARKASPMSERPLAARARAMAEAPRAARPMPDGEPAARGLDRWPGWVAHSNVPQTKGVAATVREERGGILNWLSRRSTNGVMEGMNPAIQPMKRAARGFRGLANFTAPIFLGLGRLEFAATSATGCATH
ncbi:transposase, partial [Olsenella uli]|uniref:transposase n=1 Tax=Olsenella uli TaxID=133926 RepID=UPI001C9E074C